MPNRTAQILRRMLILSIPLIVLACSGCRPAAPVEVLPVKIGSPQGAGGLLVACAAAKMEDKTEISPVTEISPLQDCCSSYAQWALSSRSVDVAVICVDAARTLIENDRRYSIIGPCLSNSDMIVVKDPEKTKTVGISQNHQYQEELVRRVLGTGCQTKPMLSTALAYAYTRGDVDGVAVDIEEALNLSGSKLNNPVDYADLVTYVLVASHDFQSTPAFPRLKTAFQEAASQLNDSGNLQQAIAKYSHYPVKGKEAVQWIQMGIRFMALN
jgi:hypothetical protein